MIVEHAAAREPLAVFIDSVRSFGPHLGPIVLQLPPWCGAEQMSGLASLLQSLPADLRFAVEFRSADWLKEPTFELLTRHNVAFVGLEHEDHPEHALVRATADFVYVRIVGKHGRYDDIGREVFDPTEQLRTWSERVIELCGNDHPDFAFEALVPMTRAVPDATQQDSIWEWLAGRFTRRKDLAAASILARADMWEKFKTPAKAWDYYNDVIERYPNDGQIIIDALARADRFLVKQNKSGEIVELYDKAWHRITKPSQTSSQFTAASTYVVVGKSYAALLEKAGKPSDAKRVRDQIKQVMDR